MTTIKLKNGSGAPAGGDLVQGEPALDLTNKRLYTEDSGGTVIEVGTNPGVDVTFADNRKAVFGAGSDLQIYHDGSNSYLKDAGTGDLYIQGEANVRITDGDGNKMFLGQNDGEVQLYYNGSEKLNTTNTGIQVTGNISNASGNLTLDVAGDIILDTGGDDIKFKVGGTDFGSIAYSNSNLLLTSAVSNGDILLKGNDGGSTITALSLDMSNAGAATFNSTVTSTGLTVSSTGATTATIEAGGGGDAVLDIKAAEASGGESIIRFSDSVSGVGFITYAQNDGGSDYMRFGTASTERMRIDSSGNVGIGCSPNASADLHVADTSDTRIWVQATSGDTAELYAGTGVSLFNRSNSFLNFGTNNTERMRIDSSGTLNLGTTLNVFGGADRYGYNFYANGQSNQSIDGTGDAVVQYINRENADGAFTEFYKDRAKVGSIGVANGDLNINGDSGIRFQDTSIMPRRAGSDVDATVDIGLSSHRWKDLYLSGTANVGGLSASTSGNQTVLFESTGGAATLQFRTASGSISNYIRSGTGGSAVLQFMTAGENERARIDASGNLLVGCTSGGAKVVTEAVPTGTAYLAKWSATGGSALYLEVGGSAVGTITCTASATAYNTSSDQRLKDNIVDAPSASDDIDAIQVRSFNWKVDGSHQKYGMVAQELNTVAPEAVSTPEDSEEMMGVDYSKLVPMLVKEIQSLRARVAQLETN